MKYKYNVIAPLWNDKIDAAEPDIEQPWTGVFENKKKADRWYEDYGKAWETRGKKLVRREVGDISFLFRYRQIMKNRPHN